MKNRVVFVMIICACTSFGVKAQTSDAETEAVINLLGVQKREIISKLVPVIGKDSVAFWKIYDAYQKENKTNAMARIKLYEATAMAYQNMTPSKADSLASQYFVNRIDQEKTLENYYKKIKSATNSVVAFEFYQAETYLLTQLRASIMQQVPTYGEVRSMAKN